MGFFWTGTVPRFGVVSFLTIRDVERKRCFEDVAAFRAIEKQRCEEAILVSFSCLFQNQSLLRLVAVNIQHVTSLDLQRLCWRVVALLNGSQAQE
jgi:hypothetical protein